MSTANIFDASKITRAIEGPATLRMMPFRQMRNLVNREFGGAWYGNFADIGARAESDKRPVNLLYQFVRTYLPNLVGPAIKVKVTAKTMGMRAQATTRELMLNHMLKEMNFTRTWRAVVQDALTGGLGVCRTGLRAGGSSYKVNGELFDMGQPYAVRVDLDDFVRDPQSRDPLEDCWRAFRYRVSRRELLELGIYDPDVVNSIPMIGYAGAMTRGESDEIMGNRQDIDPIDEKVELWDVLYYHGDTVLEGTLAGNMSKWLMEPHEYEGREGAPLELLSLVDMPNNAMPVSPCGSILDLHLAMAAAGAKMTNQLLKTKASYIYSTAKGEETAMEMRDSFDQEFFQGDPSSVAAVKSGGLLPEMLPAFDWLEGQANKMTAIHLLNGSEDTSKTATVGSYMQGNASVLLNDWRGLCNEACSKVVRTLAWYFDTDPQLNRTFSYKLPNGAEADVVYDAEAKEGDFGDFHWDLAPFVDTAMDPSLKMRRFGEFMTAAGTFLPMVMQFGGDMVAAVEVMADQYQVPEIADIFPTQNLQMMSQMVDARYGNPGQATPGGKQMTPAGPKPAAGNRPIDQTRSDMAATVPY
jgi:hypothetical protein